MILAGDVGGTKTELALFEPGGSARAPRARKRFASREHASLEALVAAFIAEAGAMPSHAVFGIAGPVVDNRCETTNLPWHMVGDHMSEALNGAPVTLLNDLVTTAWGLGELGSGDLEVLQPGQPARGNRALIAAGTGLGEAIIGSTGKEFVNRLGKYSISDSEFRDALRQQLAILSFIDFRFRPAVQIPEEEIHESYDADFVKETPGKKKQSYEAARSSIIEVLTQQRIDTLLDRWLNQTETATRVRWMDAVFAEGSK